MSCIHVTIMHFYKIWDSWLVSVMINILKYKTAKSNKTVKGILMHVHTGKQLKNSRVGHRLIFGVNGCLFTWHSWIFWKWPLKKCTAGKFSINSMLGQVGLSWYSAGLAGGTAVHSHGVLKQNWAGDHWPETSIPCKHAKHRLCWWPVMLNFSAG